MTRIKPPMCLDPVISSDINRPGFEFGFHDSEVLFNFPALLVNLYNTGRLNGQFENNMLLWQRI